MSQAKELLLRQTPSDNLYRNGVKGGEPGKKLSGESRIEESFLKLPQGDATIKADRLASVKLVGTPLDKRYVPSA